MNHGKFDDFDVIMIIEYVFYFLSLTRYTCVPMPALQNLQYAIWQ